MGMNIHDVVQRFVKCGMHKSYAVSECAKMYRVYASLGSTDPVKDLAEYAARFEQFVERLHEVGKDTSWIERTTRPFGKSLQS